MAKRDLKRDLYRAQILADFVNMEAKEFKAKNPNFFPRIPKKWAHLVPWAKLTTTKIWDNEQFGDLFAVAGLAQAVFDDSPKDESKAPRPKYDVHEAISFLHQNPWRARRCIMCKKAFVAGSAKSGFCTVACAADAKRRDKLKWWNENKETIRPAKKA
jgi:ferredoxin